MYCLDCHYDLRGLPQRHCPECGRAFDPDDEESYRPSPPAHGLEWSVFLLLWFGYLVGGVVVVLLIAIVFWLLTTR